MKRSTAPRKRGMIAAMVMVLLVVVAIVGMGILKLGLQQRSEVELEERRAQVDWLVESGRLRASERLNSEKSYRGESWKIPATAFGGRGAAEVAIKVKESAGRPESVEVVARYPIASRSPVQRTATFPITTGP